MLRCALLNDTITPAAPHPHCLRLAPAYDNFTSMTITLTPDQIAWLAAQVAAGRFPSLDAAARTIIDERMQIEADDLDWAKPLLDAARAGIARGEVTSLADVQQRLADRIGRLQAE